MIYGTLQEANAYFATRMYTSPWDRATVQNQTKALNQATRIIDRLRFVGTKTSDSQELQFPRGGDTVVPTDVRNACFEIALSLLDGKDPERERTNLSVLSQGFSGVRTTYTNSAARDHILAGVPSHTAWTYLLPYLDKTEDVRISRA